MFESFQIQKVLHKVPAHNMPLGLPKTVGSLCPECKKLIKAEILEKNNIVVMEKTCKEHGFFNDIISRNVNLFLEIEKWAFDGTCVANPNVTNGVQCPRDCGICQIHKSHTCLANIDLTNRCNLRCPICFANANAAGYVHELSFEQIISALKSIKNTNDNIANISVQFSGGEPTIHPRFIDAVKAAKNMGFKHILAATNGIRFAKSLEFTKRAVKAGLEFAYFQFDGVEDKYYKQTRGKPLFNTKLKTLENCRKAGLKVVLVPTIVKTINENQIIKILDFAIDNMDCVIGISYQPVSFTGRISVKERLKKRYNVYELAETIEREGYAPLECWLPYAALTPVNKVLCYLLGRELFNMTCHTSCGIATILFVNTKTKEILPITKVIDIKEVLLELNNLTENLKEGNGAMKAVVALKLFQILKKNFKKENLPKSFNLRTFLLIVSSVLGFRNKLIQTDWKTLYVMSMHFQDLYNYNIDRIKRCVIHYAAPDGRLYPFCSYNAGPFYREAIEKHYSVPLENWKNQSRE